MIIQFLCNFCLWQKEQQDSHIKRTCKCVSKFRSNGNDLSESLIRKHPEIMHCTFLWFHLSIAFCGTIVLFKPTLMQNYHLCAPIIVANSKILQSVGGSVWWVTTFHVLHISQLGDDWGRGHRPVAFKFILLTYFTTKSGI